MSSDLPSKNLNAIGPSLGDSIGAYRIERKLGSGGMAEVFYGVHAELNRPAAIKVLRASLAADEVHLQRFMLEARAAAALIHPNIVQVYDVGKDGQYRYIAQEYIPGSNLRQYISSPDAASGSKPLPVQTLIRETVELGLDGTGVSTAAPRAVDSPNPEVPSSPLSAVTDRQLPITETLSILLQVLAALSKSAASGIVHRDIKPENIMLTIDGEVKVADFGLARVLLGDDPQLTRAGTTLGTPMYMSPEQIQEGVVDVRSDLYSLGVTLYHMLCGRPPFLGETPLALAMQHVQAPLPDIRQWRTELPESLVTLVERLLAKSPQDRFSSPMETLEFLRQHRNGDLAVYWPEQTVPLPGAAVRSGTGPMQATMQLEARLRKKRRSLAGLVGMTLLGLVAVTGSFGVGAALAYKQTNLFDTTADDNLPEIDPKGSPAEQYNAALLSPDKNAALFLAVGRYFPPSENDINLYWGSLASLQLARIYSQAPNTRPQAIELLRDITEEPKNVDVIRALAWLELAEIELGQDKSKEAQQAIQEARRIEQGGGVGRRRMRELLSGCIQVMSPELQALWTPQ
ncbi:serine/threonine-protein kinase [Aureliella helgolandensis]|uniref:non-specific serine/threonine protein kinase n=1 Tax=Aureliella helgolandensis TaxID=2527968 RepID=A0A518GDB5_9BACT|nr:serine/threonine-protein kinase [Aureliella helgolandensis]QDV26595.1 Serine/threonine-protein kinase PrkC [Aureliella helgolandensis]